MFFEFDYSGNLPKAHFFTINKNPCT